MYIIIGLFLAIISIVLSIWFGKKYYKHVLDSYDTTSNLESASVFSLLFTSICISLITISFGLGYLISRVLDYMGGM
ncbi:hypothetical protein VL10_ORF02 [Staphylococcus phage vB_SauM_VL10]|nr:hypothetical protein VL10_ORF02 [Staphylococcus phage vB_SauM_VL10]